MSNVTLLYPGPRAVFSPVPDAPAAPTPQEARRRPLILGMPPVQFVLRAIFAMVIGFASAIALPRVVAILAEQALLTAFAG